MDQLDHRILRALQRRGDLSNAELAEEVGTSTASVWRRVRALEQAGVLGPSIRLLDAASIGRSLNVICQVRMKSHNRDARASFEKFMQNHEEVMECYSMSGEWDYLLRVVVPDVASYERFLMRELLSQEAVATSASHFALSQVKYTTALPV